MLERAFNTVLYATVSGAGMDRNKLYASKASAVRLCLLYWGLPHWCANAPNRKLVSSVDSNVVVAGAENINAVAGGSCCKETRCSTVLVDLVLTCDV